MSYTTSGFIAQEVEAAAQNIGFQFSGVDIPQSEHGCYGLRYGEFVVPLVKAVQEQQVFIATLMEQNKLLQTELKLIQTQVAELIHNTAAGFTGL